MNEKKIEELIAQIKIPVNDPQFPGVLFTLLSHEMKHLRAKDGDNLRRVVAEEYDDLSRLLDRSKIQESSSVRNVLRTRRLANLLINEKGELETALLPKLIQDLKEHLYSLGPHRQFDAKRQEHILKVLKSFQDNKEMTKLLKKISKPIGHKHAEQIVKDTLQLAPGTILTDAHARRAVLSALLCYLRQSVGSCFATAPAIIIHDDQPEQFLKDVDDLLGTGRLKRTYGGVEYSVPLSTSWGIGDLRKQNVVSRAEIDSLELWLSPGLISAFEAVAIIPSELELRGKIEKTKELILDFFNSGEDKRPFIMFSPEDIIRKVLLKRLELSEQDLIDYENRPRGMIQGSLLMQIPKAAAGSGGKGEACATFALQLEVAHSAFKGLADNALLKAWEFTIASFSEIKSGFTQWNLYASLGLNPEEKGGIGYALYEILKSKLDKTNDKVREMQSEYEAVYSQVKFLENRFRNVSSEKEAHWAKVEYQSKVHEFQLLEEMRDKYHYKASRYANLFNLIINIYIDLFQRFFQEVYDADLHDVSSGPYDDSPAGFRLIYKHGRSNTSQWTPIHYPNEFIEDLASFFTATESELAGNPDMHGFEDDIAEIVTAIVSHIRTTEFLETAFYRMAAAHHVPIVKNPLENLDKIEKKPWVYTSGGTMNTLVSCYYRLDQKPSEVGRWVENPTELLVFLIDTIKQIPQKTLELYRQNPNKSMLIHSPTHAFLLKPGYPILRSGWESDVFTYTWVRDNYIKPQQDFIDRIELTDEMMEELIDRLEKKVPKDFRHYFRRVFTPVHGNMSVEGFRDHLVDRLEKERGLQYGGFPVLASEEIDSALYEALPMFPLYQLRERVEAIFARMPQLSKEAKLKAGEIVEELTSVRAESLLVTSKNLQEISLSILSLLTENTSSKQDDIQALHEIVQELNYAMPQPILIADSNWAKDEFGFLVNPGTGKFELWRVDPLALTGSPMSAWEQWLNGSRRDRTWGLYNRPQEYG